MTVHVAFFKLFCDWLLLTNIAEIQAGICGTQDFNIEGVPWWRLFYLDSFKSNNHVLLELC